WSQRKEWIPLVLAVSVLPLEFVLLFLLVPAFGLTGAAYAYLGACLFLFLIVAYYTATAIRKYKPVEITPSLLQ
ncbi:MAG: hypothetical protein NT157_05670, partial [Candidatus Micrarchaeota archaeon]|nr:hypothetical protein [Candidatus Micrarchaeota archaeon]